MYLPEPSFKGFLNATGWGGLAPWTIPKQAEKDWNYMQEGPKEPYSPSGPRWKDMEPIQADQSQTKKRRVKGSLLVPEFPSSTLLT